MTVSRSRSSLAFRRRGGGGSWFCTCDAICAASDGEQWAQRARNLMHPTAREAAAMATQAGAGALALVHIGRFGNPANIRDEASAGFRGTVSVPDDGARLTI